MNVHFLGGISINGASFEQQTFEAGPGATPGKEPYDMSVYDSTFDHIQYDIGHLKEYAPNFQSQTYGYVNAAPMAQITKYTTTTQPVTQP